MTLHVFHVPLNFSIMKKLKISSKACALRKLGLICNSYTHIFVLTGNFRDLINDFYWEDSLEQFVLYYVLV